MADLDPRDMPLCPNCGGKGVKLSRVIARASNAEYDGEYLGGEVCVTVKSTRNIRRWDNIRSHSCNVCGGTGLAVGASVQPPARYRQRTLSRWPKRYKKDRIWDAVRFSTENLRPRANYKGRRVLERCR